MNSIKVSVNLSVSEETGHRTFDLEDMNVDSMEEWQALSDDEKHERVQKAVDSLPEHPYWVVDTFHVR